MAPVAARTTVNAPSPPRAERRHAARIGRGEVLARTSVGQRGFEQHGAGCVHAQTPVRQRVEGRASGAGKAVTRFDDRRQLTIAQPVQIGYR